MSNVSPKDIAEKLFPRGKILALATIITLLWAIPLAVLYFKARPPVARSRLNQVRIGMSKDRVRVLLGKPQHLHERGWDYQRWGSRQSMTVYFDGDGYVDGISGASPTWKQNNGPPWR